MKAVLKQADEIEGGTETDAEADEKTGGLAHGLKAPPPLCCCRGVVVAAPPPLLKDGEERTFPNISEKQI